MRCNELNKLFLLFFEQKESLLGVLSTGSLCEWGGERAYTLTSMKPFLSPLAFVFAERVDV